MRNEYGITLDSNGYAPSVVDYYGALIERCFMCDWRGDLVRHEIFGASNRKKSKALGLWVYLCPRCHMELHNWNSKKKHCIMSPAQLKRLAQRNAMAHYGWGMEEWIGRFGKNYVETLDEEP